jgi:purine-binding chemotaxis protein CheW
LITVPERFVPFSIEGLSLAIPLEKAERVIPAIEVSALPNAPAAVLGVINLGGRVIPVFDLRRRFGLPAKELLPEHRMIIAVASRRTVALVADGVKGVIEAGPEALAPSGEVLSGLAHVKGILKTKSGMLVIQDLDSFLSIEEESELASALEAGKTDG